MKTGTTIDNRKNRIVRELSQKSLSKENRKKLLLELRKLKEEEFTA